jgi:endoglucanase
MDTEASLKRNRGARVMINRVLFILLLLVACTAHAQNFKKGVNVTGWFQANSTREVQFTLFTRKDFEQIKSLGCDVIRLPINLHYMTGGAPQYTIDPLFLNMLDQVVDWAEELQISLILDNHTFDPAVDTSPDIIHPLKNIWAQMAQHYKARSAYVYYEILNEPHGIADATWAQIQQEVIDTIRVHDTQHYIVVGGSGWNGYNNLAQLPVYSDNKLIYTFHFYDPFVFTHQGATWGSPSMASLAGVPFPYNASAMPATPNDLKGTWVEGAISNYINDGTINRVRQLIDIAVAFKTQRNVPVFCGELGVYIPKSNDADRVRWYEAVRIYMEQKDIPWTMWDYKGGFGLFKKNSGEMFDYDLNVPLLQKLNFIVPPQKVFQKKSESSSVLLYDDYPGGGIVNASHTSAGVLDFYADQQATGDYCLCWNDVGQYDGIVFDFKRDLDLSKLKEHDFELVFKVKANAPTIKFDVRLVDTKATAADRPWRMGITIDQAKVAFDGKWREVRIRLGDLVEKGAWDQTWYDPKGLFDWKNIDRFEIVPEHQALTGIRFCYDDIAIEGEDIPEEIILGTIDQEQLSATVFPNPSTQGVAIQFHSAGAQTEILVYNQLGVLVRSLNATVPDGPNGVVTVHWDGTSSNGLPVARGIYLIRIGSGKGGQVRKLVLR